MARFVLRYVLSPSWAFGLPDGNRIVVPAGTAFTSPSVDMRTGEIASHGTLPVYRLADQALDVTLLSTDLELSCHDNHLSLGLEAEHVSAAHERGDRVVELCCQSLSVLYGARFSAVFLHVEDQDGNPKRLERPQALQLFKGASYNLGELRERVTTAFEWARFADDRSRKPSYTSSTHAYYASFHKRLIFCLRIVRCRARWHSCSFSRR